MFNSIFCRILLLTLVLFGSVNSYGWEYKEDAGPDVSEAAREIEAEVIKLPDPLFMTSLDANKAKQLLSATLRYQDTHTQKFSAALSEYKESKADETWNKAQFHYFTLRNLDGSKERLIKLSSDIEKDRITGFGPDGVTQFKKELNQIRLKAEYLTYFQLRSFKKLLQDIYISPVPVIIVAIKILMVYLILTWWLANNRRFIEGFKKSQLESKTQPVLWIKALWYLLKANVAITWLIAITVSLRILSEIPSLQHLVFLEIFTWWVLGGSIAISFILEFVGRNSRRSNKKVTALRLSTVRLYVWSVIAAGVVLQISMRTLSKGTIYYWIYSFFAIWFILITIAIVRKWRPVVFEVTEKVAEKPRWVLWSVNKKDTFFLGLVATVITTIWIMVHKLRATTVSILSNYKVFSQILAYMFRIEVAKQTGSNDANKDLVRIRGDEAFSYVLPGREDSELISYANDEIKQLSKYLLSDSPAVCVLSGERGIGTTTLLNQILHKVKNATPVYLNCPYSGYAELLSQLAEALGLSKESSEIQILAHLRKSEINYLIAVDNSQRLVKPKVGGLSGLMKFTNLLRRSKKNHRIVLAIEKSNWRFVDRARGERLLFDWVTFMPAWSEQQVSQLLDSRLSQQQPVSFEGLTVPKQWDEEDVAEEERAKQGFYRILWHYSDGNPTVALRFFRLSLRRNKVTDSVVVRLFNAPESEELEKMPKPMLAVLRSIVQLEVADPEELSVCTQLSLSEVIGTLRYFQSRGFIEWNEDKARVSDHWFRHITNVLHRQHLLVK